MTRSPHPRADAGVTLVELMIVIVVLGILTALALPAFDQMLQNGRRTAIINELVASLLLARSESAKRGQPVTVCGGVACAAGPDFSPGWTVFLDLSGNGVVDNGDWLDVDGDGAQDPGEVPVILGSYANSYATLRVRTDADDPAAPAGSHVFRPFNRESTAGTFTVCDRRGVSESRTVVVSTSGRARVSETGGDPLSCP